MKKTYSFLAAFFAILILISGCAQDQKASTKTEGTFNIVTTTTMLSDLVENIGGSHVKVKGLMGPGIDPHLYQASAGDVTLMQNADIVVFQGLHLEGKMSEIFSSLKTKGNKVIAIEDGLDKNKLIADREIYDPHIWFDVSLWKDSANTVAKKLIEFDPKNKGDYEKNLSNYLQQLDELDTYIKNKTAELPAEQRVLVTAHDAFNYFGRAYGFEVKGLQGISTESEAGTGDVSALADFISNSKIKAIFVESSVPKKNIEALQAAVKNKGFEVAIGGELYSDSLGDKASGTDTYILTFKANIDTIVNALK